MFCFREMYGAYYHVLIQSNVIEQLCAWLSPAWLKRVTDDVPVLRRV